MTNLRKQIKESFFNPVFHLFPLVLYLVINEFYGIQTALQIAYPVTLLSAVYIFVAYNQLFKWHLHFILLFVVTSLAASLGSLLPEKVFVRPFFADIVVLAGLLLMLVFRKQLQSYFSKMISRLVPMSNNFLELYRAIRVFAVVIALYITVSFLMSLQNTALRIQPLLLQYAYAGLLLSLVIYEIIRVRFVRLHLMKEEWWPIVSDQGKIIGSIHNLTSLHDSNKYKHPVVRLMIIDHGMVLLQRVSGIWDTAISNHVKLEENIDQCIDRTAVDRYSLTNFKYMYLSNYSIETKEEFQYAFLFVSCQMVVIKPNLKYIDQTKWWTQKQIEDNLDSGIFSENFKIEYDFLKRSGLLESGRCECNCRLKEVIYEQTKLVKKDDV